MSGLITMFQAEHLFQGFILLNLFYFFGRVIFMAISVKAESSPTNTWYSEFLFLSLGTFLATILYAIYVTKGLSVFSFFLIPLTFLFFISNCSIKWPKIELKKLLNLKLNLIFFASFFLIYSTSIQDGVLRDHFHPDLHFYEDVAFHLNKGYENTFGSLNEIYFKDYSVRAPYHYFELWLVAFAGNFFSQESYLYTIQLVVTPILLTITFAGLLAIWEKYNSVNKWIFFIVGFLLIFVGPLNMFINKPIISFIENFTSERFVVFENSSHLNYFLLVKNLPFYILSSIFFLVFLSKEYTKALLILMFGLIINVGLIPGVFCLLFTLPILLVYKKKMPIKQGLLILTLSIFLLLCIFIFYFLFSIDQLEIPIEKKLKGQTLIYEFFKNYNLNGELLRIFYRTFFPFIWLGLLYFPFVIYLGYVLWFDKKSFSVIKPVVLISVILLFGGIATRPFLQGMNSPQFLSLLLPFVNISFVILLAYSFKDFKFIVISLLALSIFTNFNHLNVYINQNDGKPNEALYSSLYKQNVLNEVRRDSNTRIGWIMCDKEQQDTQPLLWMYCAPSLFMNTYGIHEYFNLNEPRIKDLSRLEESHTNQLKYFPNSCNLKYDDLLNSFVRENKIRFVVLKKGVQIRNYHFLNIRPLFYDPYSGDRFCELIL